MAASCGRVLRGDRLFVLTCIVGAFGVELSLFKVFRRSLGPIEALSGRPSARQPDSRALVGSTGLIFFEERSPERSIRARHIEVSDTGPGAHRGL